MAETRKRRSDRISLTLPLSVSGRDAAGTPFSEDATTVTVSLHGAAIALKTEIVPGQEIIIRRLRTPIPREAECHVLGQIGKQPGLYIFSLAFLKQAVGFWDVYFPPLPSDSDTAGRALLECQVCRTRRVVHFDPEDLALYNAHRQLSLSCDKCGKSTTWLESRQDPTRQPELEAANPVRLAAAPAPPPVGDNRRKHRRVAADVPVCIRQVGSDDDVSTTFDISHGGMGLISGRNYRVGSYIKVAVPYSPTAVNMFVDARVVHISEVPSQDLYRLGIMYLAENEPLT
jgi:hypothetical protein